MPAAGERNDACLMGAIKRCNVAVLLCQWRIQQRARLLLCQASVACRVIGVSRNNGTAIARSAHENAMYTTVLAVVRIYYQYTRQVSLAVSCDTTVRVTGL